jgi:hypothetical protein
MNVTCAATPGVKRDSAIPTITRQAEFVRIDPRMYRLFLTSGGFPEIADARTAIVVGAAEENTEGPGRSTS